MQLIPFYDRIIVEADDSPEQTESGLYIPVQAKERPIMGTVLAVGPGKLNAEGQHIPIPVAVGDKVLFGKFAGTKVLVDGKELLMFLCDDLFCRIEEDEKAAA